ncbi:venom serine protease inhibitor-like [Pieris rapae]|uniref:venom serine protease inhibitor-like n=1 Tax=Pieris rapae TaxID=64459 RepID=UPI001E27E5E6|nr:venom serine protease inhibitor-like [Pieris rapae]
MLCCDLIMLEKLIVVLIFCWIYSVNSGVFKRSTCEENEIYAECHLCGPERCSQLGFPAPCGGTACTPRCVCIDGFVRDDDGKCIPKMECPSCGGDKNAITGCSNHCGNKCSDFREVNKTCLSGCHYNGCDCKPGFVFHEKVNHCVLPNDC